ncbi:MAG: hypothetical protein OSB34_08465 [Planktomarina sp.]|nr:hypothetical protein [Planktomarina sp.]
MSPPPKLLEKQFTAVISNAVWLANIAYINTDDGWFYLAGVKDTPTREIVGWRWGGTCELRCVMTHSLWPLAAVDPFLD